ncbi:hypothetical protein Tco_1345894 [Tanacetum coccineum]
MRHGMPVSIISDSDCRFTSHFWQSFQKLGSVDRQSKFHTSIKCAPFEAQYGEMVIPRDKDLKIGDYLLIGPEYELSCVHDTFHVSNLKKCLAESDVQVPLDEIEIDKNLRFVEEPIEIVERDVKKLKPEKSHSPKFA